MFVVSVNYVVPLEQVDVLRPAHFQWLQAGRDAGLFVGWGRKAPPVGGVILATGDLDAVTAYVATDPYVTGGVATSEVTEFVPVYMAVEPIAP